MAYLISKVFPFIWPYLKEAITGWIKHPYFKRNGYRMAMKKFGIICLFVAFVILGGEYAATLRELDLIKDEVRSKPPAYVSFEDVKNYHSLFNSPETQNALNQCRVDIYSLNTQLLERQYALELERQLHTKTKEDLELLRSRPVSSKKEPAKPTDQSARDALNKRLNPKKDD